MSVITQEADPHYLESRAIEMVREARLCLGTSPNQPNNMQLQQYEAQINKAIGLLALAKVHRRKSYQGEGD